MDGIKLEELEKAFKKEKDRKVRVRMVAVHVVHMLDMSVEETARIQVLCPTSEVENVLPKQVFCA